MGYSEFGNLLMTRSTSLQSEVRCETAQAHSEARGGILEAFFEVKFLFQLGKVVSNSLFG